MRLRSLLAFLLLPACVPPPAPPRPIVAVTLPVAPPPPPSAPEPPRPPPPPPPLPPCRVDPLPAPPLSTPPAACAPVPLPRAAAARAKLVKSFSPTAPDAKLAVTFACDPVGSPFREIVYEYGSGHGQNLALVRLRRSDARLEALRISLPGLGPRLGPNPAPILVERATIDAHPIDAVLPDARALLLAKLEERIPPDTYGHSGFFSSGDFHALLRVEDAAGHAIERAFTGYPSSEEQLRSMPMAEVGELLYPLVDKIPWQPAAVDADVRAFFVARYVSDDPTRAAWWVKERLVILSEHAGTPALIPSLVELALAPGEHSVARTRAYAVDALAALAGFDARKDAHGQARTIDEAAADYARACKPSRP